MNVIDVRSYQLDNTDIDDFNLHIVKNTYCRTSAQREIFLLKDNARLNKGIEMLVPSLSSCSFGPIFNLSVYASLTALPLRTNMNVNI